MGSRRIVVVFVPPIRHPRRVVVGCVVVMGKQKFLPAMVMLAIGMMGMFDLECHKRAKPMDYQDRHHQGGGNHASEHGQQLHGRSGI